MGRFLGAVCKNKNGTNWNFPQHTVVHSNSKRVGSLKSKNLKIFLRFLIKQIDSARSGVEAGVQKYLLGSD
jgi:hypothetical protein